MNSEERNKTITLSNLGNFTIKNYDKQIKNNILLHNNFNQELEYKDKELDKKKYLEMNQEKIY